MAFGLGAVAIFVAYAHPGVISLDTRRRPVGTLEPVYFFLHLRPRLMHHSIGRYSTSLPYTIFLLETFQRQRHLRGCLQWFHTWPEICSDNIVNQPRTYKLECLTMTEMLVWLMNTTSGRVPVSVVAGTD